MLKRHLGGRPLLETADELCAVARDLNADPGEIYLGGRATEREVKHLSDTGQPAQYRRFKDKPKKVKRFLNQHLSLNLKQRHLNRKTICKWLQGKIRTCGKLSPAADCTLIDAELCLYCASG